MDVKPFTLPTDPAVGTELRVLTKQAQAGDATAVPRIRQLLEGHPEVWQHVGDLARLSEHAWIVVLTAENPVAVEALKRTITEMKAELAGEHPTRLERMLVDQVVGCWMETNYWQTLAPDVESTALEVARFQLKRRESAQKRFDNAVKTLATVRQLLPRGLAPAPAIKLHEVPQCQQA